MVQEPPGCTYRLASASNQNVHVQELSHLTPAAAGFVFLYEPGSHTSVTRLAVQRWTATQIFLTRFFWSEGDVCQSGSAINAWPAVLGEGGRNPEDL